MTEQIRGVNVLCVPQMGSEVATLDTFKRLYDDLQRAGGNAVMLNPVQYVYVPRGSVVLSRPPRKYGTTRYIWRGEGNGEKPWPMTIRDDLLDSAIREAKCRGLFVGLKPMVDIEYGGWRGYLSVAGVADAFLYAYKHHFLKPYVQMAKEARADLFVLGTEMYTVTKELDYIWVREVANYVRYTLGYKGILTYAGNHGRGADAEFVRLYLAWKSLDRVGVDAYFSLLAEGEPLDEEKMLQAWDEPTERMLVECGGNGSMLVITEIGYRADTLAAVDPYADPGAGTYSPEAQVACWRAFRRLEPRAYFAWSYDLFPQHADPRSHNLRGRGEAERVALAESWN